MTPEQAVSIVVNEVPIVWKDQNRGLTFFGIDAIIFWKNPSLVSILRPLRNELGDELYSLLMANQLLGEIDAPGMLGRHLQPLVERIHQMLGTGEADARTLLKRVRIVSPAKRPVPSRWFELVGEALVRRRRVHLRDLTRTRGTVSERDVSPQRLVHHRNTWYLDAYCHSRERLLRFARRAAGEVMSALGDRENDHLVGARGRLALDLGRQAKFASAGGQRAARNEDPLAARVGLDFAKFTVAVIDRYRGVGHGATGDHRIARRIDSHHVETWRQSGRRGRWRL